MSQFRELARHQQRAWLQKEHRIESAEPKRIHFPTDLALKGANFFDDQVRACVVERYPEAFALNKNGNAKPIAKDALRSEHLPFNIFAPLRLWTASGETAAFLAQLVGRSIDSVNHIEFEHAPFNARARLDDRTAFDVAVDARSAGRKLLLGVEVKYTEDPYTLGEREGARMRDMFDSYTVLTESLGLFSAKPNELRRKAVAQLWRNYLLGAASGEDFIFVHLYHGLNAHQSASVGEFKNALNAQGAAHFRAVTLQEFVDLARTYLPPQSLVWLSYLSSRYLAPAS